VHAGDLYIGIRGERFDGAEFAGAAIEAGAAGVVVPRGWTTRRAPALAQGFGGSTVARSASGGGKAFAERPERAERAVVIEVDDTTEALQALAHGIRVESGTKVVAITGSAGKTTTKELLRHALGALGTTHCSAASYNNHWGVPLSLAAMPLDTQFGIFEVGMNHFGELRNLVSFVRPHVALVTTIAPAHLEFFGTCEAIADAKSEIFEGILPGGTALIVERKDQFAATLGRFVQENFLNADVLTERIRTARIVPRLAAWLAEPANAARVAGQAADAVVTVAEALRDEDVQRVVTAELTRVIDTVEVAPLAGRALRVVIGGGHHAELFGTIVSAADRYLGDHQGELRQLFEGEAPRWVPDAVYRRVFDRLYARLRERLVTMAADPDDETRRQFDAWLAGLPDRLETDPELRERGERLKHDVLGSTLLRDWSSELWQKVKDALRTQAADPESELRRRLADVLAAAGRRLGSDRRLADGLDRMIESGIRALVDHFHDELAGLVTGTIERWDAAETSNQLELLLGRDLQYIRINGTVVGAGVGLALHAIAMALG
jgi:uncharacterized membrane-anchored protein YjiN (DUF445 family)